MVPHMTHGYPRQVWIPVPGQTYEERNVISI